MADQPEDFTAAPTWQLADLHAQVTLTRILALIAVWLGATLALALVRKGVLSFADLVPLHG